ncbi:MAG TPA: serine hydroxymethyltransferase [Candidatus Goldiibacteriota bacterium]|nr:serine hydroxymethyltransferase [Candidatus Goldiibacteriota bacterium]HPN64090.1 serine hydroxymethyltransferase [Candidatus Goldiibacteriota bacterium]HRQ43272.1 serine hydroxymethyltransferase [Candidatus Goldiibacteriota bacterium]
MDFTKYIEAVDSEVAEIIKDEVQRNKETLLMIASENYADEAVLQAQGSVFTNKYAEGYPTKRFYQGVGNSDRVEQLAIDRAKQLFGAEHANVQPNSGSQANQAVYLAMLQPGDAILGMNLAAGGHLTHGAAASSSGKLYKAHAYSVNKDTYTLDYDEIAAAAKEVKPKIIVAGASAYPRKIDFKKFREIADSVGALLMCDIAHYAGLVAAKLYPDPVPYADFVTTTTHKTLKGPRGGMVMCKEKYAKQINSAVFPGLQGGPLMHVIAAKAICFKEAMTPAFKDYQQQVLKNAQALAAELLKKGYKILTGGTDCHMILLDLRPNKINGRDSARALEEAGITLNKNGVPFDTESPFVTSGIRIGTPAITARGMKEGEMKLIADWMDQVLKNMDDAALKLKVLREVKSLCAKFPIYEK